VLVQTLVVFAFHLIQALLNCGASLVVTHRLWLQSSEDSRPWLLVHERRVQRKSRKDVLRPGSDLSMV